MTLMTVGEFEDNTDALQTTTTRLMETRSTNATLQVKLNEMTQKNQALATQLSFEASELKRAKQECEVNNERQTYLAKAKTLYNTFVTDLELDEDDLIQLPSHTALRLGAINSHSVLGSAGLVEGDVILEVQGERTGTVEHFHNKVSSLLPGEELRLLVSHPDSGKPLHTVHVRLPAFQTRSSGSDPSHPSYSSKQRLSIDWAVLKALKHNAGQMSAEALIKETYVAIEHLDSMIDSTRVAGESKTH